MTTTRIPSWTRALSYLAISAIVFLAGMAFFGEPRAADNSLLPIVLAAYAVPIVLFLAISISVRKLAPEITATGITTALALCFIVFVLIRFQSGAPSVHVWTLSAIAMLLIALFDLVLLARSR